MQKIRQYLQNINMNREYFSLWFLTVSAVLTIAFFLLFINIFKTYTSSIIILVNVKSEVAAINQKQIVGNIIEFPKTLAFYDRLLKYNSDVRDIAVGKSQTERKKAWNNMFSIRKVGKNSSLLKISITTRQKNDADQLVVKTARTLFDFTGFYYNIKNDVDLRIIDGPISHANFFTWPGLLIVSIFIGFIITFFLRYIFLKFRQTAGSGLDLLKKQNPFNFNRPIGGEIPESREEAMESLENLYRSEQSQQREEMVTQLPSEEECVVVTPEKQEMKKITKLMEPDKYPNYRETPKVPQPKACAPNNLPIADDTFFTFPGAVVKEQTIQKQEIPFPTENKTADQKQSEPTAQQLKERLNKLLRGEM